MRLPFLVLAAPLALTVLALSACGGDGGNTSPAGGDSNGTDDPTRTPLSDEAYLAVFCAGLSNYQDALLSARTSEAISKVVADYADAMDAVGPPGDVGEFHTDFVKYLRDSVKDPTSLTTKTPPKPATTQRERLAGKVNDVPECRYPTFLGEPPK
ncbi:MAG: hypothetical protein ACKVT1_02925 [Dehalococcoidia bacterium]